MRPRTAIAAMITAVAALMIASVAVARDDLVKENDLKSNRIASAGLKPADWHDQSLTIANLGHATVLMNFLGTRMISDPVVSDRVGASFGGLFTVGPKRYIAPPLKPDDFGPLEVVLITHAHMDHLDIPTLSVLPKTPVVVTCQSCADLIEPLGYSDVRELRWGQSTQIGALKVTAMGARHWGRRWPWGEERGYNSYVLEKNGVKALLACDSAATDLFASVAKEPPEVAVFSIGAYDPWITNHANPEQVWKMFKQSGARYLIPIHWGTFRLSREPMDEPMKRLIAAAGAQADRIAIREIGEAWTMPAAAAGSAAAR